MSTPLAFLLDPAVKHERVRATVSRLWQGRERADYGLCLGLRRLFRDQVHRGKGREDGTETVKVVSTLTPAERQAERKAREVLTRATGKPVRPEKFPRGNRGVRRPAGAEGGAESSRKVV